MRVVFLGSPEFAVPSLHALSEHPEVSISLVVTQPDRPAGRGRKLTPAAVKTAAVSHGLPVFQPESLRAAEALDVLDRAAPDLLVVVAYGELLNRRALHLAPYGALNVHPSLLPKYRGAAPIQAAILNGDAVTGISIMQMERRLDAGPVVLQQPVEIEPDESAGELSARLAVVAATLLPRTCLEWAAGKLIATPQDDEQATYTREWTRADARVDWRAPAEDVVRLVRAANPWPVAWTSYRKSAVRVWDVRAMATDGDAQPGLADLQGARVTVGCGAGAVELVRVQPAGKAVMDASSWWNGLRVSRAQFE